MPGLDRDAVLIRQLQGMMGGVIVRGPYSQSVGVLAGAAGSGALTATVDLPEGATNANTVVVGLPNAVDRIVCMGYSVVSLTQINLSFYNPTGGASVAQTFRFFTFTKL